MSAAERTSEVSCAEPANERMADGGVNGPVLASVSCAFLSNVQYSMRQFHVLATQCAVLYISISCAFYLMCSTLRVNIICFLPNVQYSTRQFHVLSTQCAVLYASIACAFLLNVQ